MTRGFTLLWRRAWDHPLLQERGKKFSRFEAWFYIINVLAAGVDTGNLKRGEFEASVRFLAKAWNWSKSAVDRTCKRARIQ